VNWKVHLKKLLRIQHRNKTEKKSKETEKNESSKSLNKSKWDPSRRKWRQYRQDKGFFFFFLVGLGLDFLFVKQVL
jgi:hypothetical protein